MENSLFTETLKELGDSKVGEKLDIIFEGKEQLPDYLMLQSSCGCSKPHLDKQNNRVVVIYKPKPVPVHLKAQGYYESTKHIIILDPATEHKEVLSFKTRVYEK